MNDLIRREDAIKAMSEALKRVFPEHQQIAEKCINALPSAEPEKHYDEWCTDCKEYDRERHCCPRWNRVIREALNDAQPERKTGHWIYDENGMDWNLPAWVCSECHGRNDMIPTYIRGKDKMIKVEHPLRWAGSKYCPNCGAKMEEEWRAVRFGFR